MIIIQKWKPEETLRLLTFRQSNISQWQTVLHKVDRFISDFNLSTLFFNGGKVCISYLLFTYVICSLENYSCFTKVCGTNCLVHKFDKQDLRFSSTVHLWTTIYIFMYACLCVCDTLHILSMYACICAVLCDWLYERVTGKDWILGLIYIARVRVASLCHL